MDEIYMYNVYIDSNNTDGTNERYLLNIFARDKSANDGKLPNATVKLLFIPFVKLL